MPLDVRLHRGLVRVRTHLDLFSGYGGFALAANWAGYTTIGFCEIDPWLRGRLSSNFPGVPQHDDIKTLEADLVRSWIRAATAIDSDPDRQRSPLGLSLIHI